MKNGNVLSIFVDESGNFGDARDLARYCLVTFVLHDQRHDISQAISNLDRANYALGIDPETFQFHSMPLIRQDDEYAAMTRSLRGRILDRMLTFVRNVPFTYHFFCVDTDFVNTSEQVFAKLKQQMEDFILAHETIFRSVDCVKVYYDAGQKAISRLLEETIGSLLECSVDFAQGARQGKYKLLQVADLVCTVELINRRLEDGLPFSRSEKRFFGGVRNFKRNLLKKVRVKLI